MKAPLVIVFVEAKYYSYDYIYSISCDSYSDVPLFPTKGGERVAIAVGKSTLLIG